MSGPKREMCNEFSGFYCPKAVRKEAVRRIKLFPKTPGSHMKT
ncbi:MAG: hypothetical protein NTX62_02325 [Deltaproteobacteria bacterium]|nr:hypothetical protein [Deltaproteobacteria bacterium]